MASLSVASLPGQRNGRIERLRTYTINVVVTGRCNAACTYCHYYARRDRRSVSYDISDEQFDVYLNFLQLWQRRVPGELRYRFSGGDPMVLKDRLFDLADRAFRATGVRPFVLTAGKALSRDWVERAKDSSISHVCVSIENPYRPDPKAPNPHKVMAAIRSLNSPELPIVAGVCVVFPDQYERLFDIVSYFYENLGHVPVIHEVNYDAYAAPTEDQWAALPRQLEEIFKRFSRITPLMLFPSVSPELSFGGRDAYLLELDLENTFGITRDNSEAALQTVLDKLRTANYPVLDCLSRTCPWWDLCDNVKWYWMGDRNHAFGEKVNAYCRFKRLLNDAYTRAHVDAGHCDTVERVRFETVRAVIL